MPTKDTAAQQQTTPSKGEGEKRERETARTAQNGREMNKSSKKKSTVFQKKNNHHCIPQQTCCLFVFLSTNTEKKLSVLNVHLPHPPPPRRMDFSCYSSKQKQSYCCPTHYYYSPWFEIVPFICCCDLLTNFFFFFSFFLFPLCLHLNRISAVGISVLFTKAMGLTTIMKEKLNTQLHEF